MDDAPHTEDLDLASVTTRGKLAEFLQIVHVRADHPSLRELEARTRRGPDPLSKTVVSEMLKGQRFPRKAVMLSFLRACGVRGDDMDRWSRAWERVADLTQGSRSPPADLSDDVSADSASTRLSAGIGNPQIELLRSQIDKLDADNQRLRLQLAKQSAWWQSYDLIEGLMGAIYLERPDDLNRSHEVFSRLQSIALSSEDTASWISHEQEKITGGSIVPARSDG